MPNDDDGDDKRLEQNAEQTRNYPCCDAGRDEEEWTAVRAILRPVLDDLARRLWQARRMLTEREREWVKSRVAQMLI